MTNFIANLYFSSPQNSELPWTKHMTKKGNPRATIENSRVKEEEEEVP